MVKVLMIGWEYPPYAVGGLGTHCSGLTRELRKYVDLSFVVPFKFKKRKPTHMKVIELNILHPKINPQTNQCSGMYTKKFKNHMTQYAKRMIDVVHFVDFDVIHCQDWMTWETLLL